MKNQPQLRDGGSGADHDERGAAAERLRVALDLFEAGVALMRQNLRRRHPDWSEDELDRAMTKWLRTRPGAEHGDGVGRPGTWPRTKG